MKRAVAGLVWTAVAGVVWAAVAGVCWGQATNGLEGAGGWDAGGRVAEGVAMERAAPVEVVEVPFVAPPIIETPALTAAVEVVETVVTTNLVAVVATNRVARRQVVVSTNATLRRFVVEIDENQNPVRFTSVMSDGSVVVTPAGGVPAMTNRAALSTFNGMLRDVIGNGRRAARASAGWQVGGTNAPRRVERVWGSAGAVR
jgi:hypothetical protein